MFRLSLVHLAYTLPLLGKRLKQKRLIHWNFQGVHLAKLYPTLTFCSKPSLKDHLLHSTWICLG